MVSVLKIEKNKFIQDASGVNTKINVKNIKPYKKL